MLALAGAVFSVLLLLTGIVKIGRPHDVERALSDLGLPQLRGLGILIGSVEVVVGIGALLLPAFLVAQGLLYLGFGVWVGLALRSNVPIASCGCLGRKDTPPTVSHLALNLLAASVSFGAAFGGRMQFDSMLAILASGAVVLAGVFLSYVILTDAAHLSGIRKI